MRRNAKFRSIAPRRRSPIPLGPNQFREYIVTYYVRGEYAEMNGPYKTLEEAISDAEAGAAGEVLVSDAELVPAETRVVEMIWDRVLNDSVNSQVVKIFKPARW